MYNIHQLTNYDLNDVATVTKNILIGGDIGYDKHHYRQVTYKVISKSVLKNEIIKFGYCCEPKGLQYPIFLTINGIEKEFQLGKTGMFELQPEDWTNVNDYEAEQETSNVIVSEIKVPADINFKLDYIYSIN